MLLHLFYSRILSCGYCRLHFTDKETETQRNCLKPHKWEVLETRFTYILVLLQSPGDTYVNQNPSAAAF